MSDKKENVYVFECLNVRDRGIEHEKERERAVRKEERERKATAEVKFVTYVRQ